MLMLTSIGFSQTINIKDKETDELLEFVMIISESPKTHATTNGQGQADISAFKGSEKIEFRTLGYKTVVKSFAELESASFELLLEPYHLNIEEVVVSATRWRQTSSQVPVKIISISPREITLQNPQTSADLLGVSGKVYIQKSQQGGGSPMIRGFATNRLLYTVDGVRMNTAIFRGGNIQNVISLDAFAIENTEVFFGPGSVIYGSDAVGGVMNFQTLTPKFTITDKTFVSGKAVTRYSSANKEQTRHFDVNLGWKKWALLTSISSFDFDHLRQGNHGPDDYLKPYYVQHQDSVDVVITQSDPLLQIPTAYSQKNLMQKIRFSPNQHWDLQYGFHYSETSPYGRYDRHNRVKNGTARYAEWNYGPQIWLMNNLNISHKADNLLYDQFSFRLAQQSFEESRIDRTLNKSVRNTQTEEVEAYSLNFDVNKAIGSKNTLFYGLEYVMNDVKSSGMLTDITTNENATGPSRYPQSKWSSYAAYFNLETKFNEKLAMQTGLRYNRFVLDCQFDTTFYKFPFTTANINKGAITGSIGLVYKPVERLIISTNFGTAFRSPNVDDIGKVFDSGSGSVTVPNTDLNAEYAYNFDFGFAKIFGDALKLDITAYYTMLQDAMVLRDFSLNGQDSMMYDGEMSRIKAIQNAASAHVYGVQAGIEINLSHGFGFSSDLNYQVGEEELDDGTTSPLRHAAPMYGTTRLIYKANKLNMQLYASYQSERKYEDLPQEEQGKDEIYAKDADGNNYSPAWYTLNFKAMYQFTDKWSVVAGIENITDRRYRPYSSGMSGAGRNFSFSLMLNY